MSDNTLKLVVSFIRLRVTPEILMLRFQFNNFLACKCKRKKEKGKEGKREREVKFYFW